MNRLRHFLVYRCIGCDDPLPTGQVLCHECTVRFQNECQRPCPTCGVKHIECGCFAGGKRHPFGRVLHIAPYSSSGVAHNMVVGCKETRDLVLMHFLSLLSSAEIGRKIPISENTVLVPIPRSDRSRRKHGFDQGLTVGRYIANELGIPCIDALRNRGTGAQKKLGKEARRHNAKAALSLRSIAASEIEGKHIILYDDVTTTGTTALSCSSLLYGAGADRIDFCSFARAQDK